MAESKIQEQLDKIALETAELNLEEAKERNAQMKAGREAKRRQNAQRQSQLRTDRSGRLELASRCTHRQGGTPRSPLRGKGPTALNLVKMPDGFTELITCSVCRLRLFSPFPPNRSAKLKKGESAEDAKTRVKKYLADEERFQELKDRAENEGLTPESTTAMDCGVKMRVTDADGMPVFRKRPCDSYAMQY